MKAKTSVICDFFVLLWGYLLPPELENKGLLCPALLGAAQPRSYSDRSLKLVCLIKGVNVFQKEKGEGDRINNARLFGGLIPKFLMAAELFVALDVVPLHTGTFFLTVKFMR